MAAASTLNIGWMDAFMGWIPGSIGETSTAACLIGAAVLIFSKVGSWRVMLSCLVGMVSLTLLFNVLAPAGDGAAPHYLALGPEWHFVIGSFAFGSIFMATDPVSAAQTNTGRWIYGFMIGALTVLVRVLNPAYPAGIMLAIIFMNVFAPLIDHYVMKANIRAGRSAWTSVTSTCSVTLAMPRRLGRRRVDQGRAARADRQEPDPRPAASGHPRRGPRGRGRSMRGEGRRAVQVHPGQGHRPQDRGRPERPLGRDVDAQDGQGPQRLEETPAEFKLAQVSRLPEQLEVFEVKAESMECIVLPIHGKGLWSTMYGYLAVEPGSAKVKSITFDYGETPGLGGEIDNKKWQAGWKDLSVYGSGEVKLGVVVRRPARRELPGRRPRRRDHHVQGRRRDRQALARLQLRPLPGEGQGPPARPDTRHCHQWTRPPKQRCSTRCTTRTIARCSGSARAGGDDQARDRARDERGAAFVLVGSTDHLTAPEQDARQHPDHHPAGGHHRW